MLDDIFTPLAYGKKYRVKMEKIIFLITFFFLSYSCVWIISSKITSLNSEEINIFQMPFCVPEAILQAVTEYN